MARRPYFIRVSSQKGGVGKTVVSVNLAAALAIRGKKVLLADADFSNPCVGIHLRFEKVETGIMEVLEGDAKIEEAIVKYFPAGLSVLPGSLMDLPGSLTDEKIKRVGGPLQQMDYDFVIFDTAPGILSDAVLKYYDEALLVITPDLPSLTSVIRLAEIYKKNGVKSNFVVNRVAGEKHEISVEQIEDGLEKRALGVLPEDREVSVSVAKQIPIFIANEDAPFSQAIARLADHYLHV